MNREQLMKVLLAPIVSEKSTRLSDASRQYIFKVLPGATKPDIRKAVELMFDVRSTASRSATCAARSSVTAPPPEGGLTGKRPT